MFSLKTLLVENSIQCVLITFILFLFDDIHSFPYSSRLYCSFLSTKFCVFFSLFLTPIKFIYIFVSSYILGHVAFHWTVANFPRPILLKETDPLSLELTNTNSPSAEGSIFCYLLFPNCDLIQF